MKKPIITAVLTSILLLNTSTTAQAEDHEVIPEEAEAETTIQEEDTTIKSGISVTINSWTTYTIDIPDQGILIEDISEYALSDSISCQTTNRISIDQFINEQGVLGDASELIQKYEGSDAVISDIREHCPNGEIPTNLSVEIFQKDDVIDSYNISSNDTYEPTETEEDDDELLEESEELVEAEDIKDIEEVETLEEIENNKTDEIEESQELDSEEVCTKDSESTEPKTSSEEDSTLDQTEML